MLLLPPNSVKALKATSAFGLGRRRQNSQRRYLHRLRTFLILLQWNLLFAFVSYPSDITEKYLKHTIMIRMYKFIVSVVTGFIIGVDGNEFT